MPEPGQQAIADYFRGRAEWRYGKAAEYPEDARNLRCAEGLEELAEYVLSLDPSDQRIIELTTLGVREGLFSPYVGDSSAYAISRFRFDSSSAEESCKHFLTRLVQHMIEDAPRAARLAGALDDDEDPGTQFN
jgi:hypothetical protein